MVQILVSVQSAVEFRTVQQAGIGWIDLKDPQRGSLGAPLPSVIQEIAGISQGRAGDTLDTPHPACDLAPLTLSLAAGELLDHQWEAWLHSPCLHAFHYLKVALAGCRDRNDWPSLAQHLKRSLPDWLGLILVHYADCTRATAPSFDSVLDHAIQLGSPFVLIDTWQKDGRGLLHWYNYEQLTLMAEQCHQAGIQISLAGGLQLEQLPGLIACNPDVLAVRGAACRESIRTAPICESRLRSLVGFQEMQLENPTPSVSSRS